MDFNEIIWRIESITLKDMEQGTDIKTMLASCTEELGELAAAVKVEIGRKKKKLDEPAYSEAVDLMICAIAMVFITGGNKDAIYNITHAKLDKWLLSIE